MRFVLLVLLFIEASSLGAALDPAKSLNAYVRRTWDIDSGLPQNTITAMIQTPDGYMWFGTENGLARFDGRNFTVFDKQHTSGLMSNQISSLAVDSENDLWVGTRGGGVSRFRKGEFEPFLTQNGVPGNSVRCLHADAKGNVWIGTENSGLVRFSGGVFQTYTMAASGLLDNSIVAMASDASGTFWVATSSGLNVMERGKFLPLMQNNPATPNFIRSMYLDLHHNLWLGTNGYGVMAWQPGKTGYSTTYSSRQGLTDNTVTSIFQDSADALWVGTLNGGLNRVVNGKVTALSTPGSSRGIAVLNIMEDREGGLWIGTSSRGATCLRNNAVLTLAQSSGLPSDVILPVFEDAEQTMWIGTNQGLVHFRKGGSDRYAVHEGLPDELVSSITQDGSGTIWAGTRRGLARLGPKAKKFAAVPDQPGLQSSFVHCLFTDRNGDVWIGSRSGLTHYDGSRFVTYTVDDGLPSSHVLSIHQSRDGALWAGTDGGGLAVLREGHFTSYNSHDGLPDDVVLAITEDTEGEILLGTSSAGLVRFASGRFTAFGTAQGLPDDTIYQILDDRCGRLWMSSTRGIFSLAKSSLNETVSDGAPGIDYTLYGTGDGMRTRECSGGFQPAGARTQDGRLWFPTEAGLSVLNPKELSYDMTPLAVNLERVSINGNWTVAFGQLTLQPAQNSLTLQYAAPSFAFGSHPIYRYWMSGLEDGWNAPTMEQSARYTNVPPGEYKFRVAASRDGRHWMSEAQPLDVVLPPHYYATVPFYVGCCSLMLSIFYGLHLRRVRKMRKALRLKAGSVDKIEAPKASTDMDLIRLNASLEEAPAQLLLPEQPGRQSEHLDKVSFVLPLFVRELAEIAGRQAQARGLTLIISAFPKSVQSMVGDPRKLRHIVLNLLENAIELTPRGSVYLRVGTSMNSQGESYVHFSITDTGMGLLSAEFKRAFQASDEPEKIAPEQFEQGAQRLYAAIRTARLVGGEIWVESKLGVGNTFHFKAPLSVSLPSRSMLLEATAI
jgi:ligand-binding sensor domain-containing protein